MVRFIMKNIVIGALPMAYVMLASFISTLTGFTVFSSIGAVNVIGFLISVKIITIEFAMASYLYKDRRERVESFITNALLVIAGFTIFAIN